MAMKEIETNYHTSTLNDATDMDKISSKMTAFPSSTGQHVNFKIISFQTRTGF